MTLNQLNVTQTYNRIVRCFFNLTEISIYHYYSNHMAKSKTNSIVFNPLGDRVLLQRIEEAEQVRGGIIIPDSAKEKPQEATVIAIGTGKKDDDGKVVPFSVKVGDKVLLSKYGGTEIKLNDADYLIVREDDILGVVA